jgi:hypothetical protein
MITGNFPALSMQQETHQQGVYTTNIALSP